MHVHKQPFFLKWLPILTQQFAHQHCYLCHQSSHVLICDFCSARLTQQGFAQFSKNVNRSPDLLRNAVCLKNLDMPNYDHLLAIDNYIWPISRLVLDMKFGRKPIAAQALAGMFVQFVILPLSSIKRSANNTIEMPELLVPVPLALKRYWHREYNQAQLLCDWLSKMTKIPNKAIVQRTRNTQAQAELDKQQRIHNVAGAFTCGEKLECKHIAVIDDVVTTGVTINEVCRAISKCNPHLKISVWAMAITILE